MNNPGLQAIIEQVIDQKLSDPGNLPPELWDYALQHQALNAVPVQATISPTIIASGVGSSSNSPTRYVGGTTSGAPTSGTFVAGDFVVSHDGHVYICTANGTPGTWVTWQAQGVIDFVFLNTTVNVTSTNFLTPTTIVTTPGVTYPASSLFYVEVFMPMVSTPSSVAGDTITFQLYSDSTLFHTFGPITTPAASVMSMPLSYQVLKSYGSSGSHTISLKAFVSSTTGTPAVSASLTSPGVLRTRYA